MITTLFLQRWFRRSIWAHKELLNFPPAISVFFPESFLISVVLLCLVSLRGEQHVRIKTRTRISLLLPSFGIKKRVSRSLSWSVHTHVSHDHTAVPSEASKLLHQLLRSRIAHKWHYCILHTVRLGYFEFFFSSQKHFSVI